MNESNTPIKSDDAILLLGRVALGILGGFLLLFVTGGGQFSLDALLRRRKEAWR